MPLVLRIKDTEKLTINKKVVILRSWLTAVFEFMIASYFLNQE